MDTGDIKNKALEINGRLREKYPAAKCTLNFTNPLELLIATILAAQCTDARVNLVTAKLFKKYKSVSDYARAGLLELIEDVKPTGFYKNKATNIIACCQILLQKYEGNVPQNMDDLVSLPGVGRKTANVIRGNAYNQPGIIVDTHMRRVSFRLGLTKNTDPVKIEFDLQPLLPQEEWVSFSHRIVEHGRTICVAARPKCGKCFLNDICPKAGV